MAITVVVRSTDPPIRLTFDGTQRVVIGRGPGSDVRLPDATVSHRHATLRSQGAEFVVADEGSTNGTYVGAVRLAPNTTRIVRSGDRVRVGRLWLELRIEREPVTRDVAAATRDLALALVSQAVAAAGEDVTMRVRVVEGPDQGATLRLEDRAREYVVGRAVDCDLSLADEDVSRAHVRIVREDDGVVVADCGAKNGTWLGARLLPPQTWMPWRPAQMLKVGRSVLALEEPLRDALARLEQLPDEPLGPVEADRPQGDSAAATPGDAATADQVRAAAASVRSTARSAPPPALRWSVADIVVMSAALAVLAVSLVGLVWLLRT